MKVKKLLLLLALTTLNNFAKGQTIKTYTGNYEGGKATYQYYENENQERVFNGKFIFTKIYSKVVGQFKNNNKDGVWNFSKIERNRIDNSIKTIKVVCKYDNGYLVGEWSYSNVERDNYGKEKIQIKRKVNFDKNIFSGNLIKVVQDAGIITENIAVHFNTDGTIDSVKPINYKKKGYPFEAKFYFKNGLLYKAFVRNLSNGEIEEKFDKSDIVISFSNKYNTMHNVAMINKEKYTKEVYKLEFNVEDGSHFQEGGTVTNSKYLISDTVSKSIVDQISFQFHSFIDSRADAFKDISNELLFWLDVASGQFFGVPKGNKSELIYPKVALVKITDNDERVYINEDDQE